MLRAVAKLPAGEGEGDMLKSLYDTNDDGSVDEADTAAALTGAQAAAIAANTAKVGITAGQAAAITANTAKTGVTDEISNLSEDTTPQAGGVFDSNSHQVRFSKGSDVASANALTLGDDGNYFDITGTTAITSITTKAIGTVVKLHFDGILTLTHHATDLILPSGANVTTAAGDEFEFTEYATGDWRCTGYVLASGEAVVGGAGGASEIDDLSDGSTPGDSTYLGDGAGANDDAGNTNVGVGKGALAAVTSGDANTAMGYNALNICVGGAYNTAVGYGVLEKLSSAASNVGVGAFVLQDLTTGTSNIAIGNWNGRDLTTGSKNTLVGNYLLRNSTTGTENTIVGASAMYINTGAGYNTIVGAYSLYSNSSGAYNTTLGHQAGRYITGGVTTNTTSDYCVFVGKDTKPLADNDQNEIIIGYDTTGNGSNTTTIGNSSITKCFLQGGLKCERIITAKTGNYTVLVADSNTLFTNEGAGGAIILTLPTAVVGLIYEFYVQVAQTLTITASAGDTIRNAGSVSSAAGTAYANTVGNLVKITAINATEWVVETVQGTWTLT